MASGERAWENSDARRRLSAEADRFSTSQRQVATGLEAWFSVPEVPALPPPRKWTMAIVTFFVAYIRRHSEYVELVDPSLRGQFASSG